MIDDDPIKWRYQVLRKIYELADGQMAKDLGTEYLAHKLGVELRDVYHVLRYLDNKGLIKFNYNRLNIKAPGIDEIEQTERHPERETQHFPANITYNYTTHNYGHVGGIQQGGQGNTQSVTITNNPEFNSAISELLQLVEAAKAPAEIKEGLTEDIQTIEKLAAKQPAPGLLERAKGKIDALKIAITATDVAIKSKPFIEKIYAHFERWLGQ